VLDYDPKSGRTGTTAAERLIGRVHELGAKVQWLLETHVHADHLSAAPYLKERLGGKIAIGAHVTRVQDVFGKLFNAGSLFAHDGSQFDHLLSDGECFAVGALQARAIHTPGHTPACMTYVVSDGAQTVAFVGDTLFMPDYGTARCDFPGGNARTLYQSINKVLSLPAEAWFRKRCFWVTQASGIVPLFKTELVSHAILMEVVDLHWIRSAAGSTSGPPWEPPQLLHALESPSPSIHVSTRKRLAVLWHHRPRSGRRPEDIRVRCKTFGAAILRLKKLDVDSIRYLVAAAATCRLHSTAMCGARTHALELMEDAVVAITKTQSTEAERRAPSLTL